MGCNIYKLDDRTWRIEEEGQCNVYMYLLTGADGALLLDTGLGTVDLKAVVRSLTDLPVTVLNTHGHFDHIGGNGWFDRVLMHRADRQIWLEHKPLCEKLTPGFLAPREEREPEWFDEGFSLDLGGRPLEVFLTPGHTGGCLAVLDGHRRWLFTGDTCCKAAVLLNFDHSASLEVFRQSIQSILDRREAYDTTWPSHHSCPVPVEVVEQFRQAADQLLSGEGEGTLMQDAFGPAKAYPYGDIAILYKV